MYNHVMNFKSNKMIIIILCFILFNIINITNCYSNPLKQNSYLIKNEKYDFVQFDLIFGKKYKKKSSKILLGLKVTLSPKWKIYWRNPGDAGLPPEINIKNTKNIKNTNLLFPSPKRFNFYDIETFGYEKEVIFPLIINVIDNNKNISGTLLFNAQICSEICVPVSYKFNLSNLNYDEKNSSNLERIIEYSSKVPRFLKRIDLKILSSSIEDNKLKLNLVNNLNIKPLDIIIEDRDGNIYSKPFFSVNDNILHLMIDINGTKTKYIKTYFKLTFLTNNISYEKVIDHLKISKINNIINENFSTKYFGLKIIFIAFLGGIILNFMPCVLPVLSLKLVQLVTYRAVSKVIYRKKIFFNILGILTTFLLLATTTHLIKATSNLVGWGIQFQNPYFLFFMIMLTLFFALNLFGMFQYFIPSRILTFLSNKKEGFTGDFLTGVFLTFLATPCTAPLVGTAIGFALSGDPFEIYSILLIMGLGLSSPLILIILFPSIISLIPKPGNWLIMFKKAMASLLLLTSIWLTSILLELKNNNIIPQSYNNKLLINWDINRNANLLNELVSEGKIVFLDITAEWCLTCKVNKLFVIDRREITELFKKNNIIILRLDWTKPNNKIKKFLQSKNRFGIPFNEIYGPSMRNGKMFPELLSINLIKQYIQIAK